jgi:hypothetical protein
VLTDSEDPQPAPASRKGRKKKTEVEAAEAEAAAEELAAAGGDAALTDWLDSGGSAEEDRRRFPYHRCPWQHCSTRRDVHGTWHLPYTQHKAAAGNAAMIY